MTYKEFFNYVETGLGRRLSNLSCLTEKVHTKSSSSCTIEQSDSDGSSSSVDGSRYNLTTNDAYNKLNAWMNKFIGTPKTGLKEIPIISASRSGNAFVLKKGGATYTDAVSAHSTMFHAVFYAMMSLFIELNVEDVDYRYADINFNIINGYADSSKTLEDYNASTEEFFQRAEYWNVRGHLYELLAFVEDGIANNHRASVDSFFRYLDDCQRTYEAEYPRPHKVTSTGCVSEEEGGADRDVASVEAFWKKNGRLDTLDARINDVFGSMKTEINHLHREILGIVFTYIKCYNDVSEWLSKGDTFISALQKTSTAPGVCLGDAFKKVADAGSFSLYSPQSLDLAYSLFVKAKAKRDASHYSPDEHNMYLRKYMTYEVLTHFSFFETAVFLENRVKALRQSVGY